MVFFNPTYIFKIFKHSGVKTVKDIIIHYIITEFKECEAYNLNEIVLKRNCSYMTLNLFQVQSRVLKYM